MRFDAPTFARAWRSVAQASSTDKDLVTLDRTVAIEDFPAGVRLVATDRYCLLTAWVPDLDATHRDEPGLDEVPDRVVIAKDSDSRGRGLLDYVLTLTRRDELDDHPEGTLEIQVMFDVRLPPGTDIDQGFEGLDPKFTVMSVPDVERVYLPVVEAAYPDWRPLLLDHQPEETKIVALNPEIVARVATVRRWSAGPLVWLFGGAERVARVDFPDSWPHITGLVMPRRSFTDSDEAEPA